MSTGPSSSVTFPLDPEEPAFERCDSEAVAEAERAGRRASRRPAEGGLAQVYTSGRGGEEAGRQPATTSPVTPARRVDKAGASRVGANCTHNARQPETPAASPALPAVPSTPSLHAPGQAPLSLPRLGGRRPRRLSHECGSTSTPSPYDTALAPGDAVHGGALKPGGTGPRRARFPAGFLARPSPSSGEPVPVSRHHGVLWRHAEGAWAACTWNGRLHTVVGVSEDEQVAASLAAQHAAAQCAPGSSAAYSGISWRASTGRWTACHTERCPGGEPRALWLGQFDAPGEAQAALDAVARGRPAAPHRLGSPSRSTPTPTQEPACAQVSGDLAVTPAPHIARTSPARRSSFKGVSVSDAYGKWRAQVWDGAKVLYIGSFDSEEAAARAYDLAVLRLRGPSARTNFLAADYTAALATFPDASNGSGPGAKVAPSTPAPSTAANGSDGSPPITVLKDRRRIRQTVAGLVTPSSRSGADSVRATTRVATASKGSSAFKGVSWSERSSKWRSQIWHGGRVHHLGFFDDETEAATAFDTAARELRGDRAVTNFASTCAPAAGTQPPAKLTPKRRRQTAPKKQQPPPPPVIEQPRNAALMLLSECAHANILDALSALSPAKPTARQA